MDLRKHTRITTEDRCKASFRLGGQLYSDIEVTNLGADGCCLEIPTRTANGIKNMAMLEGVELRHPGLPRQAVKAQVVWMHSKKGNEKEWLQTGIQFRGASADYCQEVDQYVAALVKANPPMSM